MKTDDIVAYCNACGNSCVLRDYDFYHDQEPRWIRLMNGKVYCLDSVELLTDDEVLKLLDGEKTFKKP